MMVLRLPLAGQVVFGNWELKMLSKRSMFDNDSLGFIILFPASDKNKPLCKRDKS